MKEIFCITFHASYNYGSCLQAFALQESIKENFPSYHYEIVNFRTKAQRSQYFSIFEKKDLKSFYLRFFFPFQKKKLKEKQRLFEAFLADKLDLSKEFIKEEDLKKLPKGAVYFCGSDQIWNLRAKDFSWSYFLEFVKDGKKISYATSFGSEKILFSSEENERIKKDLSSFSYLGVRDDYTFGVLRELGYQCKFCIDPTMLLTKERWEKILSPSSPTPSKPYILFYDLSRSKKNWRIAKLISKRLRMPIYITTIPFPRTATESFGFKRKMDTGPTEFLNLLSHASLVLSSSFHGTMFSVLFHRPFYSIGARYDNRISSFLSQTSLQSRSIDSSDLKHLNNEWNHLDFSESDRRLSELRNQSLSYLKEALVG